MDLNGNRIPLHALNLQLPAGASHPPPPMLPQQDLHATVGGPMARLIEIQTRNVLLFRCNDENCRVAAIATASADQTQSRLLTLPRELRDLIYDNLLTRTEPINTNHLSRRFGDDTTEVDNWLALSLTCRQVHHETHAIFFTNAFRFYIVKPLPKIPSRSLQLIKSMCLYRWRFSGLAELHVTIADRELNEWKVMAVFPRDDYNLAIAVGLRDIPTSIREMETAAVPAISLLERGVEFGFHIDVLQVVADKLRRGWWTKGAAQ